ncbi:MAG: DUF1549 and DUF1553 domain-containing protein [Verrucomicrobiota bacterium]
MKLRFFRPLALGIATIAPAVAFAAPTLDVFPEAVHLRHKKDTQSIVVRITQDNGIHRDVTAEAQLQLEDPAKADFQKGAVLPKAEGKTNLKITWNGLSTSIPVTIENPQLAPTISFRKDVMPVLMKAECNRCHGAARGQDGFRLSLWGFDPEGDHFRITREFPGRRINLAAPEESLMLTKSDGEASHTGGKRFEKGSLLYNTMLSWLKAGAPNDSGETVALTGIDVMPKSLVLEGPGQNFHITVRANYADGTSRDVTSTALFLSSNDGAAKIAQDGIISTGQRGEAFVMARYGAHTVGIPVVVLPKDLQFTWPKVEEKNEIDKLVNTKLYNLRVAPSERCDDLTFLRRLFLDLTGTLPPPDRVKSFPADTNPNKREQLIDELLARPEFVDLWTLKWSDLLQIRSDVLREIYYKPVHLYHRWLREQIMAGVPLNKLAAQLVSASGSIFENPPATFYHLENDPIRVSEDAAQAFLGIRLQCAQCHNHPFDRWTMDDYRGFMAFFMQIGRKNAEDPRERIIYDTRSGEAKHPVGDRVVPPKFPGGEVPSVKDKDRRQVLADWLADPENPWFGRHIANLVWAHFLGVGIVDPVDDVRVSNPPSNKPLLDHLAKRFAEMNFDIRKLAREICVSETYQRSTHANPSNELDSRNFAKATVRRMRAEVLLDSISQATAAPMSHQTMPVGLRAVEVSDAKKTNYFLTTFGRSKRETVCARDEVSPTLSQALHLLTGDTIETKITAGALVDKMLKENKPPMEIVEALFLRSVSRMPDEQERSALEPYFSDPQQIKAALVDVQWALLNSKEFIFNH